MHTLLSNGYQLVPDVLSHAEIVRLRDAITETVDRVAHALRTPFEESYPALDLEERLPAVAASDRAYAAALFHAVMADTQRDPRLGALAEHPELRAAVSTIISPRPWLGQVIRTRVAMHAPTAHSPWHQDVTVASPPAAVCAAVTLACWIPLTDVGDTTDALEVMPGHWMAPLPHVSGETGHLRIRHDQVPQHPTRAVDAQAGDVVILDRYLPHRSLPVAPGYARWSVVIWVKAGSSPGH